MEYHLPQLTRHQNIVMAFTIESGWGKEEGREEGRGAPFFTTPHICHTRAIEFHMTCAGFSYNTVQNRQLDMKAWKEVGFLYLSSYFCLPLVREIMRGGMLFPASQTRKPFRVYREVQKELVEKRGFLSHLVTKKRKIPLSHKQEEEVVF